MKQTVRLRITRTNFRKNLYKRTTYTNLMIRRVDTITNEDINNFLPIKNSEILYQREKNNNLKHTKHSQKIGYETNSYEHSKHPL